MLIRNVADDVAFQIVVVVVVDFALLAMTSSVVVYTYVVLNGSWAMTMLKIPLPDC